VSHGKHRAPKTPKSRRLRRIAAGLSLAAAATTGTALTTDLPAPPADTAWGAPDTSTVTTLDTAWG
jgi:hypothetical protein